MNKPAPKEGSVVRAVGTIAGEEVVVSGGRFDRVIMGRGKTRIAVWYPERTKLFDGETGMDRERQWRIHPADLAAIHANHPRAFMKIRDRWRDAAWPNHVMKIGRSFVVDPLAPGMKRALVILLCPGPDVNAAEDDERDPTLRSLLSFARREKWASLEVSYLFSRVCFPGREIKWLDDRIAPEHDEVIKRAAENANIVIAAWGGSISFKKKKPADMHRRDWSVIEKIKSAGHETLYCFDRDGVGVETLLYPPSPLTVRMDAPICPWNPSPSEEHGA